MKKKQGFTLIELLAVIVILAIIALIATPMILGVIEKAKKGAFESSVKQVEDIINLDIMGIEKTRDYTIVDGKITNDETSEILSSKGGNDLNGTIKVRQDGIIMYAIENGKDCIIKRDGQKEIEKIDIKYCNMDVATNLVINGYGEYGDNINFTNFTYENGSFTLTGDTRKERTSDEMIKIDSSKQYYISADMKTSNTSAVYYTGLKQFDYNKKTIYVENISYIQNTLTTLARDLNNGDTVVYLNDLSSPNWLPSSAAPTFQLGFIFWNYKNSNGYEYPELTYSRNLWKDIYTYNAVNQSNNTITLKSPWNKGTIKAGTKVSRSSSNGATYSYGIINNAYITTTYQNFNNTISGTKDWKMEPKYFTSATDYIQFFSYENFNEVPNTTTYYKNIVIREIES